MKNHTEVLIFHTGLIIFTGVMCSTCVMAYMSRTDIGNTYRQFGNFWFAFPLVLMLFSGFFLVKDLVNYGWE